MKKFRRRLFGPSKEEIWQEFSRMVGGDFEKGKWGKTDKVYSYHKDWEILLDSFVVSTGNSSVPYTRFRSLYVYRDNFTFRIIRRNIFRDIGKKFGLQDIVVGHPRFDRDFIIQGTDERKLKMLFANPRIRELVSRQKHIELKSKEDEGTFHKKVYPEELNELYFAAVGIIKDLDRLYEIYDLFAELLDQLYEIGTADPDDPEYSL